MTVSSDIATQRNMSVCLLGKQTRQTDRPQLPTHNLSSNLRALLVRRLIISDNNTLARIASTSRALPLDRSRSSSRLGSLSLHERIMSLLLLEAQQHKASHDNEPVQVVRQDAADGRGVLPAQQCVEDAPAVPGAAVDFGVAAVHVPDGFADVVGTWARAGFGGVTTGDLVPL